LYYIIEMFFAVGLDRAPAKVPLLTLSTRQLGSICQVSLLYSLSLSLESWQYICYISRALGLLLTIVKQKHFTLKN